MNILIVDDEKIILKDLREMVSEINPKAKLICCMSSKEALKAMEDNRIDIALLDVAMPVKNGVELAKELKMLEPKLNIIFITGYSEYAVDAVNLHASGYLLKPVRKSELEEALENLRHPIEYENGKIEVHCFGNFDVYMNGKLISFSRSRTKELLAYLIDRRGASANTDEICAVLFEDEAGRELNKHYFRNLISDLKRTLDKNGAKNVLIKTRNSFAVNTDNVECDYYKYLNGEPNALNSYSGEYMMQYSWAEMTNGFLYSSMMKNNGTEK